MNCSIMSRNIKDKTFITILAFIVLTAGIVIGSVMLMKVGADGSEGLKNYLNAFIQNSQQEIDKTAIFQSALKENIIYLLIIFFSGFFRIGVVFIAAALIRKGFIMGFTAAALVRFFGWKGILVTASMLPGILLIIPAFLIFSALSADFALSGVKKEKQYILCFLFFAIITVIIFCAAAFAEGWLTTAFMKWLSAKII